MAASLKANNFSASEFEAQKAAQGLEAWQWVEKKYSSQNEAVDVSLYSIQGLPNNCKKKA